MRRHSALLLTGLFVLAAAGCSEPTTAAATDAGSLPDWGGFHFDFGPIPDLKAGDDDTGEDDTGGTATDDAAEEVEVCAPDCGPVDAPRGCGPDGCGGVCGTCDPSSECLEGVCTAIGGSCALPVQLTAAGGVVSTNVVPFADASRCLDPATNTTVGEGSADIALDVDAGVQPAHLSIPPTSGALLVAANLCGLAGTCTAPAGTALVLPPGRSRVSVEGAEGIAVPVTLIQCASTCSPDSCLPDVCGQACPCAAGLACRSDGVCAPPQPAESCTDRGSLTVGAGLTTLPLDFADRTRDVACTPAGLLDAVYGLAPQEDVRLRVAVTGPEGTAAWVGPGCADRCPTARATPSAPLAFALAGGTSASLIVEAPPGAKVDVTLSLCTGCDAECPCFAGLTCTGGACVPPLTHDGCDDSLTLSLDAPVSHSLGALTDEQQCFDGASGLDAVTRFTAPAGGQYGLRFDALHALDLYELTRCGDPSSCARSVRAPTEVVVDLAAGESTTWIVDRAISSVDSGFTVTVTDCAQACVGAPCDAPVCGRTCGCADGLHCAAGACVAAPSGDGCSGLELNQVPASLTVDLGPLQNDYACRGRGTTSPDAAVRFVAPGTGTFVAKVAGLGQPVVYRSTGCGTGLTGCRGAEEAPVVSQETFFARQGESVWLVLDRLAPEGLADATVLLTVSRVTGLPGSLGAACASSADCTLAERCLFGVCTQRCASNAECGTGTKGPRGTAFGCPTDVCLPGPDGCIAYCTAGAGGSVACSDDASCGGSDRCTGFALADDALTPFCAAAGTLTPRGAACTTDAQCASHTCAVGACREPCRSDSACTPNERCLGIVADTVPGGKRGVVGACLPSKDLGATCTVDANCVGGSCDAVLGADGTVRHVCRTASLSAQFGFGDPCASDAHCKTGRCLFGEVLGLLDAYCSSGCTSDADCTGGTLCRPFTVWDGDTPGAPDDDVTLPLCQRGSTGSPCLPGGANTCDAGLACVPTPSKPAYGTCTVL